MNVRTYLSTRLAKLIQLPWKMKLLAAAVLAVVVLGGRYWVTKNRSATVTFETTKVEKGTLITSVSGSGTITSGNNTSINTKVSGVVETVYVSNGDIVAKGQKIAEITLDDYAKERQAAAWVKYLEAKEAVLSAQKDRSSADLAMWEDREKILEAEEDVEYMNNHKDRNPTTKEAYTIGEETIIVKTLEEARLSYAANEAKFVNAGADIAKAQANVTSALREYQENSSTIVAPVAGTISDMTLAPGFVVTASSTTSNTSGATIVSTQSVGKISDTKSQLMASVSLSEVDILNVKANQKVTLTLDAYEDKTFTGKVLAVNTSGSVSSGVTSYPVTVLLDPLDTDIYPNMAVSVEIITNIKPDVLIVPSTAITTVNNQPTMEVMKNGKPIAVTVQLGASNDSQTEITSGLNIGDEVVTSTTSNETDATSGNTSSPFSGIRGSGTGTRGGGGFGGGPPGGF